METRLHRSERCLFVPLELLNFTGASAWDIVERFRGTLLRAALSPRARELLIDEASSVAIIPVRSRIWVGPSPVGKRFSTGLAATVVHATVSATERPVARARARVNARTGEDTPVVALNGSHGDSSPAPENQRVPLSGSLEPWETRWDFRAVEKISVFLDRPLVRRGSEAVYLPDDTAVVGLSFAGLDIATVRLERPGRASPENIYTIQDGSASIDLPQGVLLGEVASISVAKGACGCS